MPRTKKQVVEAKTEEIDFENLETEVEEEQPKKKRSRKKKEAAPKKTKKEKYKANPKYKIKDYCDIYTMYLATDKNRENLLLTFNPIYNNIYASPNVEFEAIEEMKSFAKFKENKTPRIIYSKGDIRKTDNDWGN